MMDDQMASILTGNLIRNAFRYTPDGGKIEIRISSDGFSISNTGVSPLDKDKVFHKFYQPAGKKEGSTGLGLTLVRCVCVNNGLQASYDYADGKHIFAVILKKSK
jgi:signal transduction histidine kinase